MAEKFDCSLDDVADALKELYVDDREEWLLAGMAIKSEFGEGGKSTWLDWSEGYKKYKESEALSVWNSFKKQGISIGSLFNLALGRGFKFNRPEKTPEEKAAFAAECEARRAKREAEEIQEEADALRWSAVVAQAANDLLPQLKTIGRSPYLGQKHVRAFGIYFAPHSFVIRTNIDFTISIFSGGEAVTEFFKNKSDDDSFVFFKKGSILVPVRDVSGSLQNFQIIFNDGKSKRFLKHGRKSGLFHIIGDITPDTPIIFCEGYATGASLHMATGWPVVVCFDAGNMPVVAELFKQYSQSKIFAGDNDWKVALDPNKKNTGLIKAREAATLVGAAWCVPEFSDATLLVYKDDDKGPSDFNDLQIAEGGPVVAHQINSAVQLHSEHFSPSAPPNYDAPPDYEEVPPGYEDDFIPIDELIASDEPLDPLYIEACTFVIESQKATIASLQRHLRIGYNRAASLIDAMHNADIVSAASESGGRSVLLADCSNIPMPPAAPSASSPAPSVKEEHTIENLLKRYALTEPDAKVWDSKKKRLLKTHAFKVIVKSKLYDEWLEHDERLTVNLEEVEILAAAAQKRGRGGLGDALRRYVYLNPSDTVWDRKTRKVVAVSHLKIAIADWYGIWVTHPERDEVPIENFVFDPTRKVNEKTHINQFRGIELKPVSDSKKCERIVWMLFELCNKDKQVFRWLRRWLAYPLINIGAKMETAVLCHSDVHGSGKSYFFDVVMRSIYGEYSRTVGQAQLEGQYNDWMSKVLYCVYEEVLSRSQRYSHTGTIKQTITGKTVRIEKKFMSGWEESNHMNSVFLSNEVLPLPVEPSDRRFLVIWPETKLYEHLQRGVNDDLQNGGAAAFYQFLLDTKMQEPGEQYPFDEHTKPPMTAAKERLIDHGRSVWEAFYLEWKNNSLQHNDRSVPYGTVRVSDLFKYFRAWCSVGMEHSMGLKTFTSFIESKEKKRKDIHFKYKNFVGKATFFVIGTCPENKTQEEWFGACVEGHFEILNKSEYSELPNAA